jgi:hypothetical protein
MGIHARSLSSTRVGFVKSLVLSTLAASILAACGGASGLQQQPSPPPFSSPLSTPTPVATPLSTPTPVATPLSTPTPVATPNASLALRANGALDDGKVGISYGYFLGYARMQFGCGSVRGVDLKLIGGVPPYTWHWASAPGSSLPPGLHMALGTYHRYNWCGGATPTILAILGTPLAAGTYNVVVTVTDSASPPAQTTGNYSITVNP